MSELACKEYNQEVKTWLDNAWLIPYSEEELGPPNGLVPLMAVIQQSKEKVRPVIDHRELNEYVEELSTWGRVKTRRRTQANSAIDIKWKTQFCYINLICLLLVLLCLSC